MFGQSGERWSRNMLIGEYFAVKNGMSKIRRHLQHLKSGNKCATDHEKLEPLHQEIRLAANNCV
jgi:hypothetical protein